MPSTSERNAPPGSSVAGGPVAVVDLGSNSVRLVVFDGPPAAPLPKFNEKVLCGLGRRLAETGRLDEEGVALALAAMRRFTALARRMRCTEIEVVATAAVRDAENGPEFVAEVERACGISIRVLSGEEEAHISAMGVLSGIPDADGVMGDLGGGSLELVALDRGRPGESATLPLGPFRLSGIPAQELRNHVDQMLASVPWLDRVRGKRLYAVGGAWRAIARIHMAQHDYPLRIIHHYCIGTEQAGEIARLLARQSRDSLMRIDGVPRRRLDSLPLTAFALRRLLKRAAPVEVVFSAHGLREGLRYAALPEAERRHDPLITACRDVGRREGRFGEHGAEYAAFVGPLFPDESETQAKLRLAAALLSDVAWRVNPDYRGVQAFRRILLAPFAGIDHVGRAFVALSVFARYEGSIDDDHTLPGRVLLRESEAHRALVLGLGLRLAHSLTGGTGGLPGEAQLRIGDKVLLLEISAGLEPLLGESVLRRLDALGRSLGLQAQVKAAARR